MPKDLGLLLVFVKVLNIVQGQTTSQEMLRETQHIAFM